MSEETSHDITILSCPILPIARGSAEGGAEAMF